MLTRARNWLAVVSRLIMALIASAVISVLFIVKDVNTIVTSSRWIRHTGEVLISLEHVTLQLALAESAKRGYIITADPKYLDRYRATIEHVEPGVRRIRELVRDNPGQQEAVDILQAAIAPKLAEMADLIALREAKGFQAAQAEVRTDRGYVLMEDVLRRAQTIRAEEQRLLDYRRKWQDKTFNRLMLLTISLETCGLLYMYFLVQRKAEIGRRVAREHETVTRMVEGMG